MSASTPYSTSDSLVFKIITFRGYEFAVESHTAKYVLVSLVGSDAPGKLAARTRAAIKSAIIALYEEMQPDPEPTAPASILVMPSVRIYAVSEQPTVTTNNTVRIPQPRKVGQWYSLENVVHISETFKAFTTKHGVKPTSAKVNPGDWSPFVSEAVNDVVIVRDASVPSGSIWIGYDPKLGEKVA